MNILLRASVVLLNDGSILNLYCNHYISKSKAIRGRPMRESYLLYSVPTRDRLLGRYANHNDVFFHGPAGNCRRMSCYCAHKYTEENHHSHNYWQTKMTTAGYKR